ncbi:hypothetical protein D9M72_515330 [compost metagenome]
MVVLPDPEGPMMETFSPGATSKFSDFRTWFDPQFLLTFWNLMIGSGARPTEVDRGWGSVLGRIAPLQSVDQPGGRVADCQEQQRCEGEGFQVTEA